MCLIKKIVKQFMAIDFTSYCVNIHLTIKQAHYCKKKYTKIIRRLVTILYIFFSHNIFCRRLYQFLENAHIIR